MPTLPDLLQEPAVQELRELLMNASPRVREAVFFKYFSPILTTPKSDPDWLQTDSEQYLEKLRDETYTIQE